MQEISKDFAAQEPEQSRITTMIAEEERARATYLLGGAAVVGLVFLYLQFRTQAILDVDGYYHIKWSRLLWEGMLRGAFPHPFPYLPLTTLNPQDYVDHHLLFHLFLIPFTWFGDLRVGAKAAAVIFGSLGVVSCYWLILRYRIRYAPIWLLALLASAAPFLYRLSMTRAQTLSIVFLIVGIYLLFEGRYRWLAPLAFLYVWYYSLFVLLGAAAVIWSASLLWSERRVEWRPVLWTAVGMLAGFLVNPYFPKNVVLFVSHVLMKVNPKEFSTSVGAEWYPYDSWYFAGSCGVAFAAMIVGYIAFNWEDRQRSSARAFFFLVFSTVLLIANARSRRFVEYWPPFAILFAAFSLQAFWASARSFASRLPSDVIDDLQPFLDRAAPHEEAARRRDEVWHEPEALAVGFGLAGTLFVITVPLHINTIVDGIIAGIVIVTTIVIYYRLRSMRKLAVALAFLALCLPIYFGVRETGNAISGEQRPDAYRGGAEWLRTHVPPGEIIFNTDWDDFPKLFFYDSEHRYASGLDPTYLLEANPPLSKLYESITLGREENSAELIRDRFGARYVFTDNEEVHEELQNKLIESGWFEIAYHDDACTVLRMLDERREPGAENNEGDEESQETDADGEGNQTAPM